MSSVASSLSPPKEFELIVFGATSFVGKILCHYLCNEYQEPNLRWAMAARSGEKLAALQAELGPNAAAIPLLVAESSDTQSLEALCQRTELIISTVGPYALYGEQLVAACARAGVDYCDLTGEPQWIRRMIERYEPAAQKSGARIVHSCGFDSIPSDMGVKHLQQAAESAFGVRCNRIKMRVVKMKGGASGGTVASGLNVYREAAKDPALRAELRDMYSLCPPGHSFTARQPSVNVEYDEDSGSWAAPFIMASINTRIVLRSNALWPGHYATNFVYDEALLMGAGEKGRKAAKRLALGMKWGMFAMAISPLRALAQRLFLPKPGEGPTPEQQLQGMYDLQFVGSTPSGDRIVTRVTGDRDPGYGSTAKMLAQAGISLRRDVDQGEVGGGFWTTATVFNSRFLARLQEHAGLTFSVLETERGTKK
ncbi:MAG: saccharopine dehydrogenase NADP-binding domain-containing protein [Gammaproteobacteria bacterium]|jgi:short subunit dehydrogenase-like uncharacterized protein|nr:saccharopine dehydrogenase NADP-binding domain-containing protein [Gammaproteobacteria bacterium]